MRIKERKDQREGKRPERWERGGRERDSLTGRVKDHARKGHRYTEDTNPDGW